jgi:hypothetical protein
VSGSQTPKIAADRDQRVGSSPSAVHDALGAGQVGPGEGLGGRHVAQPAGQPHRGPGQRDGEEQPGDQGEQRASGVRERLGQQRGRGGPAEAQPAEQRGHRRDGEGAVGVAEVADLADHQRQEKDAQAQRAPDEEDRLRAVPRRRCPATHPRSRDGS